MPIDLLADDAPRKQPIDLLADNMRMQQNEESYLHKLPRNIAAGFASLGHTLLNAPHDLFQGAENAGSAFGAAINLPKVPATIQDYSVAKHIPQQQEYNFAEILGQKGEPTTADWYTQKAVEHLPEALGLWGAYKSLPIALTKRGASRELRQASKYAAERGVKNLNIPSDILEDIPQFLPKTKPYENLLKEAGTGDYEPIFALQSDLEKSAREFSKNPFSYAERMHGKAAGDTRQRLLESFRSELEKQGNEDIANLMKKGQNKYRNYHKIKKYRNLGIGAAALQAGYGKKLLNALGLIND